MSERFAGKVALVTGATRGIGAAELCHRAVDLIAQHVEHPSDAFLAAVRQAPQVRPRDQHRLGSQRQRLEHVGSAPDAAVGLNDLLGRTVCAISVPPSGLRVELEDAQLLVAATGFSDARGPRDGLVARGQL
jgi:NAD(P)-dependent dehydrogenase (short-subunit alcohol dehydrogenase family)